MLTNGILIEELTPGNKTIRWIKRQDIQDWADENCEGTIEILSAGLARAEKCYVRCELEKDATIIALKWG